jgi:cell division ATPase FtsA
MLTLEAHRGKKASVEMIATFLPNVVVEGLYSVMDLCGLSVASLTLEPIAAMNAIIPKEIRLINIALVDIGAGTSDIAISKDGSILAYAMATTAGDEITEEIIKTYFVDFDTAESIKQTCCAGQEYIYKDIFGIERGITPEDFVSKIHPSVEVLAETICENILKANDGAPAAVFLIGGGSLIKGLPEAVAKRLEIPLERVARGSNESLKGIDTCGNAMGAEFITPLGIAVTGILNKGYDFSVVTLNDKAVRIFNNKKITVFELLTIAGYKSAQILGRSGHNLTYSLNGERRVVRGGGFEPAQISLDGESVSLHEIISGGAQINFTPAVCGENARLSLKEAVLSDVLSDGRPIPEELQVTVNGKVLDWDYQIKNLDKIETFVEGEEDQEDEALKTYKEENEDEVEAFADLVQSGAVPVFVGENDDALVRDITVVLNGESVALAANEDGSPHTFIELLNYADMDFDNPKGDYIMLLNSGAAGFADELSNGDECVLKWKEE